ncbi:DUF1963 domain-containing protein [Streptomyces sp. SID2119]|uniref:DUF1963 domain-containing protein n=1 Tax=Streptomyces sp. SID2119 TaxID=2690253 RepID=UPI001F316CFB|nr:DUF1963 domain-containing protein [Streptomyces sp. SID2119]
MTHGSRDAFRSLALRHLPPDDAEKWLGLLRPGARLRVATGADVPAVRLGGLPALPATSPWPEWEGHGPLSFIASADCARLPTAALDIGLPESGTLLFFYFDGQLDDGEALVLAEDRESWAGARLLYVAPTQKSAEREAPAGLKPYPVVPLTARVEATDTGLALELTAGGPTVAGTQADLLGWLTGRSPGARPPDFDRWPAPPGPVLDLNRPDRTPPGRGRVPGGRHLRRSGRRRRGGGGKASTNTQPSARHRTSRVLRPLRQGKPRNPAQLK